jgi:hypothetical protein
MPNSTPVFAHPVVSALLAGVVAAGVAFALRPAEAAPDQGGVLELQRAVGELQQAQQQLTARLDALAACPPPPPRAASPSARGRSLPPTSRSPPPSRPTCGSAATARLPRRLPAARPRPSTSTPSSPR